MANHGMKFHINNIGKISEADIALDGITIIAGENNVGKSTIGKALFSLLYGMDHWKERYEKAVRENIAKYLEKGHKKLQEWCMEKYSYKRSRLSRENLLIEKYAADSTLRAAIEDYQISSSGTGNTKHDFIKAKKELLNSLEHFCIHFIQLYSKSSVEQIRNENKDFIESWVETLAETCDDVEIDEISLQRKVILQTFQNVFHNQYRKYGSSVSGVKFTDGDDNEVSLETMNTGIHTMIGVISEAPGVHFIESPKIYDLLSDTKYGYAQKAYMQYLMQPNIFDRRGNPKIETELSDIEDISENKSNVITEQLEKIMQGRPEFRQKVGLEFIDDKTGAAFHAVNVSTGVKGVALLEYGIRIGAINPGDILILDEPELNLHPEWQVEYARALVMMQKDLGMHVLVTSHSPFFIRALEVFTDQADVMNQLNVYRFIPQKDSSDIKIVDAMAGEYGMTDLYDDLSAPLDQLESIAEEMWNNDDERLN